MTIIFIFDITYILGICKDKFIIFVQVAHLPKFAQNREKYHAYMVDVAATFGANRSQAYDELLNVVQFEFDIRDLTNSASKSNTCNFAIYKNNYFFYICI